VPLPGEAATQAMSAEDAKILKIHTARDNSVLLFRNQRSSRKSLVAFKNRHNSRTQLPHDFEIAAQDPLPLVGGKWARRLERS